ncbi:MAG: DUF134 domain-containing protein [Planctomycetota bacterium]
MVRKACHRCVNFLPPCMYFAPKSTAGTCPEEVIISLDEIEALRLADLNGLYQESAAEQMKVSRATFARIVTSAHKKVAEALVLGKAIRVEGGNITMPTSAKFKCADCSKAWEVVPDKPSPEDCPTCSSRNITRLSGLTCPKSAETLNKIDKER